MNRCCQFILGLLFLAAACTKPEEVVLEPEASPIIKGVDASYIPEIRASGMMTRNRDGQPEDMLTTLQQEGVNTIRLRLWKDPAEGHSGFEEVRELSQEIREKGMKVWITVHYSDTWADPGHQYMPRQWTGISYAQLKDSVYRYTQQIVREIAPDYIQIGNEINGGFLWPEGRRSNLAQLLELVNHGVRAVREQSSQTRIMLHYAGYQQAASFFEDFRQVDYDIIALSYYPNWHGKDLDDLQARLPQLATAFNKEVVLAETSYPFTLGWNDWTNNVIGSDDQILAEYPATKEGQRDYLAHLKSLVLASPEVIGFCYWGAEWISFKGDQASNGSSWENQALWDFDNRAVPALEVFNE